MSKLNGKLTDSFLLELFKLCFIKPNVLEVVSNHLQYSYIPTEFPAHKKVLKGLITSHKLNQKTPTYGAISQSNNTDQDVQDLLAEIKETEIPDVETTLENLEEYIKSIRFTLLNEKIVDLYKEGKKDQAMTTSAKESQEIVNFSIRNSANKYMKVFADFKTQQRERSTKSDTSTHERVPFSIDPIDDLIGGGMEVGETALWIMRSGVGKSTTLKWTGMQAARLGYKVLHIQLEGSAEEAYDKYTQVWTAQTYSVVKNGDLSGEALTKCEKIAEDMLKMDKDVTIYSFEKFNSASVGDVREIVMDYQKVNNCFPDLIIVDSLDLLIPDHIVKFGVDTQSIKMKLQMSAQLLKNMCIEFKTRVLTATQTGDVPPTIYNDPDKVITRNNTEGDRTLIKSFSYVLTFNQTDKEVKDKEGRVFCDKIRNYDPKEKVYKICTAYATGRFYDKQRTLKKFYSKDE